MSDSENESGESLQHDRMSVSDQEADLSREDDMPSVEVDSSEGMEETGGPQDEESLPTDSPSNEEITQSAGAVGHVKGSERRDEQLPVEELLDEAAVNLI